MSGVYGRTSKTFIKELYKKPHYVYQLEVDGKVILWSADKKRVENMFKLVSGNNIDLWQLKNGNYHKLIKSND